MKFRKIKGNFAEPPKITQGSEYPFKKINIPTYIGNSVNGGGNIGITVQMIMVIEHVLTKMILFFSQIVLHCSYFTLVKVSKFSLQNNPEAETSV